MDKQKDDQLKVIKMGFGEELLDIPIDKIMPLKPVLAADRKSVKYKKIMTSIKEVGVIESPMVTHDKDNPELYILLDGHLRIDVLKQLGESEVTCLISNDDEAYTYNKHVNHISPIQKHRMVKRAIEKGVSEEKIAQALGEEVKTIVLRTKMLDGICPEAIELLKDKMVANKVFGMLKKVKPMRQIEMATLMNDAGHYSHTYAKYLMASTKKEDLLKPDQPKKIQGVSEEQMARMENEMANLDREYRLAEETYSSDVLNLTLAKGYLGNLLGNERVVKYLGQYHAEILSQFQIIADIKSISSEKEIRNNTVSEAGAGA